MTVCPNRAFFTYEVEPFAVCWPRRLGPAASQAVAGDVELSITQPYQVAVVNDWCNACGNCSEFCPTAGHPHDDKPRIILNETVFRAFDDNAFHARRVDGELELLGRQGGATHRLRWSKNLIYEGPGFGADLDVKTASVVSLRPNADAPKDEAADWSTCFALLTLGRGLVNSQPGLLAAGGGAA